MYLHIPHVYLQLRMLDMENQRTKTACAESVIVLGLRSAALAAGAFIDSVKANDPAAAVFMNCLRFNVVINCLTPATIAEP